MICLAVKTVPYNWDSMTYHLPRLFYWLQNGTVGHYAVHNDRQVASPVLGAFVNLQIYTVMNQNDIFINLLQCFSFLTNGVLVYHITKKIKCSESFCVLSAVLFYSMPIAFSEAFTTQVDNYSALWMLCFVYLVIDLLNPDEKILLDKLTLFRIGTLSLCVAFAYLAKPSVGIGMVFFALWLLIIVIKRKDNVFTLLLYLLGAGFILAAVLAPEFLRNIATYSALSSPQTGQRQLIGSLHSRHILVNFAKNFTFNMPTVWIYNSTEILYKCVMKLAGLLEIDINNPGISEDGREFSVPSPQSYGHDSAINPVIVYLLIGCVVLFLIKNRKKHLAEIRNSYFIVVSISFLAFCAVLRWEPFVSRYMISYLAMLCPAIAGQLELFLDSEKENAYRNRVIWLAIVYFLCGTELFGVIYYNGRIALSQSKPAGYFENRKEIEDSYMEIANFINSNGYTDIGLITSGDSYEYPLIAMLENDVTIQHVNVTNATEKYEKQDFIPDIIVTLNYNLPNNTMVCHGREYKVIQTLENGICLLKLQ